MTRTDHARKPRKADPFAYWRMPERQGRRPELAKRAAIKEQLSAVLDLDAPAGQYFAVSSWTDGQESVRYVSESPGYDYEREEWERELLVSACEEEWEEADDEHPYDFSDDHLLVCSTCAQEYAIDQDILARNENAAWDYTWDDMAMQTKVDGVLDQEVDPQGPRLAAYEYGMSSRGFLDLVTIEDARAEMGNGFGIVVADDNWRERYVG